MQFYEGVRSLSVRSLATACPMWLVSELWTWNYKERKEKHYQAELDGSSVGINLKGRNEGVATLSVGLRRPLQLKPLTSNYCTMNPLKRGAYIYIIDTFGSESSNHSTSNISFGWGLGEG